MRPRLEHELSVTRRQLLTKAGAGVGMAALAALFGEDACAQTPNAQHPTPLFPNFAPRAKRVIYLTQSGAPSQVDLFDYKPVLEKIKGKELPDSVRMGQKLTTMTAAQKLTIQPSHFK